MTTNNDIEKLLIENCNERRRLLFALNILRREYDELCAAFLAQTTCPVCGAPLGDDNGMIGFVVSDALYDCHCRNCGASTPNGDRQPTPSATVRAMQPEPTPVKKTTRNTRKNSNTKKEDNK